VAYITEENKTVFYISATEISELHGQSLEFTRKKKSPNLYQIPSPQKNPKSTLQTEETEWHEKLRIQAHMS